MGVLTSHPGHSEALQFENHCYKGTTQIFQGVNLSKEMIEWFWARQEQLMENSRLSILNFSPACLTVIALASPVWQKPQGPQCSSDVLRGFLYEAAFL